MTAKSEIYLPDNIKDLIGQLAIATAKSTDPANKISLTSSRISFDMAAMKMKCRNKVPSGLYETLYDTLRKMIAAMIYEDSNANVAILLRELEQVVNENSPTPSQFNTIEAMECLSDYNAVLECRTRWAMANATYMKDHEAWGKSNAMLADIHDVLTRVEIRHDLIVVPKNISWDISDFNFRKSPVDDGNVGG